MLFTSTTCRCGNHCWVNSARAGCRAITLTPKATRLNSSNAKPGVRDWASRNRVPSARVTEVSIRGENREAHQPMGMASTRFPQYADEPSMPCWKGDSRSSALIAGSRMPMVDMIMKPATLAVSQMPMTTQR